MTRCSRRALLRGAALIPLAATAADGLLDEAGAESRYFSSHGTYDHHTLSYDLRLAYDPSSGTR
ncbi:M1 family peptidase, partial [Streptomyces sp. NPDC127044]